MIPFHPLLRGSAPPGWICKESITLLAPDGGANVIASSEPIDPSMDSEAYARSHTTILMAEFPGYIENAFKRLSVFGEYPGYYRLFQWLPPEMSPVVQHQIYYAADGRGFSATATTSIERSGDFEEMILEILQSIIISRPSTTTEVG